MPSGARFLSWIIHQSVKSFRLTAQGKRPVQAERVEAPSLEALRPFDTLTAQGERLAIAYDFLENAAFLVSYPAQAFE
ncbi:MAG: hypothetical protein AAFY26_18320 [Cyanobacteria bacterium J06638_22]